MTLEEKITVKKRTKRYLIKNTIQFPTYSKDQIITRTKRDLVKSFQKEGVK